MPPLLISSISTDELNSPVSPYSWQVDIQMQKVYLLDIKVILFLAENVLIWLLAHIVYMQLWKTENLPSTLR